MQSRPQRLLIEQLLLAAEEVVRGLTVSFVLNNKWDKSSALSMADALVVHDGDGSKIGLKANVKTRGEGQTADVPCGCLLLCSAPAHACDAQVPCETGRCLLSEHLRVSNET